MKFSILNINLYGDFNAKYSARTFLVPKEKESSVENIIKNFQHKDLSKVKFSSNGSILTIKNCSKYHDQSASVIETLSKELKSVGCLIPKNFMDVSISD